uniref:Ig-like domain-containing protein n=1 Tax=Seriola dumerili TaxID=41447 RepID=A0A3B4TVL0_SERDU
VIALAVGLVLYFKKKKGKIMFFLHFLIHFLFVLICVLPCSFQGGSDVVIHWFQVEAAVIHVHSFFYNKDQLTHQHQRFRNRTSLFKDQISGGNASLQLTGLQVQDQGRYKCYTGTNRENYISFNNLIVRNRITCSSEGIYPEPELTWSTSPPSNVTFKNQTEVQETEQLLYNIRSSLTVSDSDSDLSYSCSISTRRNKRRATLVKLVHLNRQSTLMLLTSKNLCRIVPFTIVVYVMYNVISLL